MNNLNHLQMLDELSNLIDQAKNLISLSEREDLHDIFTQLDELSFDIQQKIDDDI